MIKLHNDLNDFINKIKTNQIVLTGITIKEIVCLLGALLTEIYNNLPDSTPSIVKAAIKMVATILDEVCNILYIHYTKD